MRNVHLCLLFLLCDLLPGNPLRPLVLCMWKTTTSALENGNNKFCHTPQTFVSFFVKMEIPAPKALSSNKPAEQWGAQIQFS